MNSRATDYMLMNTPMGSLL